MDSLMLVVVGSAVVLAMAYRLYGSLLARLVELDDRQPTPAVVQKDGVDFQPLTASALLPQHFSAIAAAGPIVGPIVAGIAFGWLPVLLWILVGAILIGGVHDFLALVASLRHRARSIAEVVRQHMSPLAYLLFLIFIWIALVYIIVAFTDITAASFVGPATEENGGVGGGAIATSSALYLVLTMVMGLLIRFAKWPAGWTTALFILLVAGAIAVSRSIPLDIESWLTNFSAGDRPALARKIWGVGILLYCVAAAVAPVWLLLQPRGQLGGWFLYLTLAAAGLGLVFGGMRVQYPAFRGWEVESNGAAMLLFPMLFITVACGACSGFHSLIASGTTSKQLRRQSDAKVVGYGTMLLEGLVAVVSLCCVMMFAAGSTELTKSPNQVYAFGIGRFLEVIHVDKGFGMAFALMAFTTFVYDTLDVCARLGRYIIQELTGLKGRAGRWLGTVLTVGIPIYFLLRHPASTGQPAYRMFWSLFGASNQLLAALTLVGVTVWLWRTRRAWWVWPVVAAPAVWMFSMSTWALAILTFPRFRGVDGKWQWPADPVPYAGLVLLLLAGVMLAEAIRVVVTLRDTPPREQWAAG